MPPNPSRAQQRFLGLISPLRSRTDAEAQPPTSVRLQPEARTLLAAHLQVPGRFRAGLLFGSRDAGEITVIQAAPSGYPCLRSELRHYLLAMDESYVLGWSDCLSTFAGDEVDWVGHWVMASDNRPGTLEDHLAVLREAGATALVDEEHVLMFVGVTADRLEYSAYKLVSGEAVTLPVSGTARHGG